MRFLAFGGLALGGRTMIGFVGGGRFRWSVSDKFHSFLNGASISVPGGGLARLLAIAYGRAAFGFSATTGDGNAMTEPLGHHAALIYVMVTMSAVDRTMTDAEIARIGQIVSTLPIFADFDQENLVKTAENAARF